MNHSRILTRNPIWENFRKISIFSIIYLLTVTCHGQANKLVVGTNSGKHFNFYVEKVNTKKETIIVKVLPAKNSIASTNDSKLKIIEGIALEDNNLVPSIVNTALADKIPALKNRKTYIQVRMYLSDDGSINSVEYIVDSNMELSVDEIELISKRVIEQVKVKFPEKVNRGVKTAPVVQVVRFR